jgi:hypothetical protein
MTVSAAGPPQGANSSPGAANVVSVGVHDLPY